MKSQVIPAKAEILWLTQTRPPRQQAQCESGSVMPAATASAGTTTAT